MTTRESRIEGRGWQARSVLESGGKRSATPLSNDVGLGKTGRLDISKAVSRPPQSQTWRCFVALFCFCILPPAFCLRASGQNYSIDWYKIAGGGGTSSNGQYTVSGTIGQPDAGPTMTNGQYSLTGGFWVLPQAVQTEGAPTLTIVPASAGFATISWTSASTNWVLQETASLSPTNWVNAPSGFTNPVVVPATLPTKFYRLFKP